MDAKKELWGDEVYYKVKEGKMNFFDAMGPDYDLETDPDRFLLHHKPRSPQQIAFTVRSQSFFFHLSYTDCYSLVSLGCG
jgi:hypothetical protein